MSKLTAKQKMLKTLAKSTGYNTFTTKQAQSRFGIMNVSARVAELRQDGNCIYTNTRQHEDGRTITFYRLGTPTKALVRAALNSGYSLTA